MLECWRLGLILWRWIHCVPASWGLMCSAFRTYAARLNEGGYQLAILPPLTSTLRAIWNDGVIFFSRMIQGLPLRPHLDGWDILRLIGRRSYRNSFETTRGPDCWYGVIDWIDDYPTNMLIGRRSIRS